MANVKDFRVIIAGGGVSGLALANCLELAGIEYVLLEARNTLTPFVGAGLCCNSGSSLVFEQLGIRQQVFDRIASLRYIALHYPNGDYIDPPSTGVLLNEIR
jgi:2-polyprenyl-6-methoxyphenol hydroxylase-like FAD-dependent oxidoreductase